MFGRDAASGIADDDRNRFAQMTRDNFHFAAAARAADRLRRVDQKIHPDLI